jgi:homospermidine synthase
MYYLHGRLHSLESKRGSALVSMGCNPGSVSVWLKGGLEFVSALKRPDLRCGYGERARLLGLETVHVSECDT